jgi:uncharacterized protein YdhG (YjbR/CyaY superfamily)
MVLEKVADVDEYISKFPENVQKMMTELRNIIHETVPGINEKISWDMPTFFVKKIIIQFAGHKNHIGIYPGSKAIEVFQDRLNAYVSTKGGFQIPYGKPIPAGIMREIVEFNLIERQK